MDAAGRLLQTTGRTVFGMLHFIRRIVGNRPFFIALLICSLPILSEAGSDLSNEEAAKIITAHFRYPIIISRQARFRENSRDMLLRMQEEGYIVAAAASTCCGTFFATTAKGKPHFGEMVKLFSDGDLYVDCFIGRKTVKSIKKIRVRPGDKSAVVEYIEGLEPNEPVYSGVFKYSREGTEIIDFNKTEVKRVKLKYGDQGWQVKE